MIGKSVEILYKLRAGSFAIDFTQLGHRKCFGAKQKTESELEISNL